MEPITPGHITTICVVIHTYYIHTCVPCTHYIFIHSFVIVNNNIYCIYKYIFLRSRSGLFRLNTAREEVHDWANHYT